MKRTNERRKNNKGFSLVELIIVIAIMAVLVGILAPQFLKYVEKSRESTDIKNFQEVISAIQVYGSTDNTTTGEVKFVKGAEPVYSNPDEATSKIKKALVDAGVSNVECKSNKYNNSTFKVSISNDGILTITVSNEDTAKALGINKTEE